MNLAMRATGAVLGLIGAVGDVVVRGLAVASAAVLPVSLTLLYTGRGLHAQAGWARVVAGLNADLPVFGGAASGVVSGESRVDGVDADICLLLRIVGAVAGLRLKSERRWIKWLAGLRSACIGMVVAPGEAGPGGHRR